MNWSGVGVESPLQILREYDKSTETSRATVEHRFRWVYEPLRVTVHLSTASSIQSRSHSHSLHCCEEWPRVVRSLPLTRSTAATASLTLCSVFGLVCLTPARGVAESVPKTEGVSRTRSCRIYGQSHPLGRRRHRRTRKNGRWVLTGPGNLRFPTHNDLLGPDGTGTIPGG